MTLATYYDILNVSPRANDALVRQAYRAQAKRWHPDQNPHNREAAERVFRQISRAYLYLKTQRQRDAYNRALLKLMQSRYEASNVLGYRRTWPPGATSERHKRSILGRHAARRQTGMKDTVAYG